MSKITLNNVGSLIDATTAVATINANSAVVQEAFDNTLSRDGTSPNQMENNFDMNGFQVLNLPYPATGNAPLRLTDLNAFNGGGTISTIPAGGTQGQVLAKTSATNYAVQWSSTGGGTVSSVGLALPSDFTISNSPVSSAGTLTGTWTTTPTGTGAIVRTTGPALISPDLGTPTAAVLTNATGLPLASGVTGTLQAAQFPALTGNVTTAGGTLATTIANNSVTNAMHATMAANTIKANATSSTAVPTDISIPALTQKSSPVSGDMIMIADSAASNQLKYATVGSIGTIGSVSSIAGNTGAFTLTKGITNSTNAIGLSLTNATLQVNPGNPTATTNTTGVMMGLGGSCTLTPVYSGRVHIQFIGYCANSTVSDGANVFVKYGSGTAPTNGSATAGTQVGNAVSLTASTANGVIPFTNGGIITGLTPGTAYWFDIYLNNNGGGSASVGNLSFNAFEF